MGWPMEYAHLALGFNDKQTTLTFQTSSYANEQYETCATQFPGTRELAPWPTYYLKYKVKRGGAWTNNYATLRAGMFQMMFERLRSDPEKQAAVTAVERLGIQNFITGELYFGMHPSAILSGVKPTARASRVSTKEGEIIEAYERCQAIWASEAESLSSGAPAWWIGAPGIRAIIQHYDDPPPQDAMFLRSPAAAHAAWEFSISN